MKSRRGLALAAALLVLLSACGMSRSTGDAEEQKDTEKTIGAGLDLTEETPAPGATQAPAASAAPPKAGAKSTPAVTRAPAGGGGTGTKTATTADLLKDRAATGVNARLYLRPDVPKLVVEMGVVSGKQPTQASLDHLKKVLTEVVGKPSGVEFRITDVFESSKKDYSMGEIEELEEEHRQTWSDEKSATLYLLFLNGELRGNPGVLGVAWRASSVVIFTDLIRGSVTELSPATSIERAVMTHEVGHSLSLVNLTYRSPRDHEDPQHRGHSKSRGSVMYWAVESISVAQVFSGGPPSTYDADDKADLKDIREGRL